MRLYAWPCKCPEDELTVWKIPPVCGTIQNRLIEAILITIQIVFHGQETLMVTGVIQNTTPASIRVAATCVVDETGRAPMWTWN